MNDILPIGLVIGVIVGLFVYLQFFRRHVRTIEDRVLAITNKTRSPGGVNIWIEDGAECSLSCQQGFERGLQRTFEKAGCAGYTREMDLADYTIAVVKGEPDSNGDPAYRLPAGPYAGTIWDKGGYILVAGQCVFIGDPFGNIIAIPEHLTNFDHAALVAEYEAEHVILAWNDGEKFEATKIHGVGKGHPILDPCPGTESFVSTSSIGPCGFPDDEITAR